MLGVNNGTLQGNATYTNGEVGQAFLFDGTNGYVQIPDSTQLSPHLGDSGELTLEAWVLIPRLPQFDQTTSQPYRAIVVKGSPGQWEYGLYVTTNGQPVFGVWQLNGNGYAGAAGSPITTNQWHHLAGVLKKGQYARLFVDGQLAGESTSFSGDTSDGTSPLYIGRRGDGQNLDGAVDEISLYARALGASEIQAIYSAGSSGKCTAVTGASVPYFTDFEAGIGPEWAVPLVNSDETLGFTRFSGRFGNNFQMVTLTNLTVGQSYTIGFDFYAIDTWDGNGGPDYFNVSVNGVQVLHETFSNYNGEPPSQPQTFRAPDEGRANFGFGPTYVDAIYRNIEVAFTASNAIATVVFDGQGLQAISDESWGIDNVSARLTSDLTNTFIRSTSLPVAGSTNSDAIDTFTISARRPLLPSSATNASNYSLREAGSDGVLGNGDDTIYTLAPYLPGAGGRSVAFTLPAVPLQPGRYRFQTLAGLLDANSNAVPVFTRDFVIANPTLGRIESTSNDTLANAVPLPVAESPTSSGFFTAFAVGTFFNTSDVDYWSFNAEAGDVITVRLESESQGVNPHLRLRNAADQDVVTADGGSSGVVQIQNVTISTPGTYYLRVWSSNNRSRYWMRLDQSRGPQMESESNNSQAAANQLNLTFSPGVDQGRVIGSLPTDDAAGDYFRLGTLNVGNSISVTTLFPTGSVLNASQSVLSVQIDGNPVALATNMTGNLNYTVVSNGIHYVHIESTNLNLRAQYLLNVTIGDGVPPTVTDTSLPAEGTTTTAIVDRFTVTYSEDIYTVTASNSANYELRGAGGDGVFGTADDTFYNVAVSSAGYTTGLVVPYSITDGPLQPGKYRLTVSTNITDRANNHMVAPFVRNFSVANISGYVLENRNDDSGGLGTLLGTITGTNGNGTFAAITSVGTPGNPQGIASGRFNGDTNLDLVTANWNGGGITVFTNNGAGVFTAATNIATGNNPVAVAVGDFNNDAKQDLAVANYNSGTVSILRGDGNAGFQLVTNLTGFSNPYNLAVADLNHDNKPDLVVPNAGSGAITVLLGNGDGTFQAFTNYATGSYPECVATGDLNNDNKPDLAVVNRNSATVTVLLGNGDGSFQVLTNLPTGATPSYVAIADVTGDGIPDIVTVQYGENSVSVFAGNGDGTFQPRRFYFDNTTSAYGFALADVNGDGAKDIVVPGYGNNTFTVLLNDGAGGFTNIVGYGTSGNPIGVVAGDFDGDGRPDLAFCHYGGDYISVWSGTPVLTLVEDPPGSGLRTVSGRGIRSDSNDVDFWRFQGNAGDQAIVAVDVPGNPANSQMYYQIQQADGGVLASFYASANTGWGQSPVVTLPYTGTYLVRVAKYYDYQGEYRIRVTLARPPLQLEAEDNNSLANANTPSLTFINGHLQGTLAGYLSVGDSGDYYYLGNLPGGSAVRLGLREPLSSGLAETLWVYNSSGILLTNSGAGVTNFVFTIPAGQDSAYYVRVTGSPGGFSGNAETALRFSGGSDYVDLGSWFNYQSFTLSAWLNPAPSQNSYADILDDNHANNINWVIEQNAGNNNQYNWGPGDSGGGVPFSLTPNVWQNLTITRDATNINRVYLNGVLIGSNAAPGQINYNGNQFLSLARWVGGGGRGWNGMMDELRIWNRDLSPAEVAANLTGSLTGNEPNLVGYWRFNEGAGTNAFDLTASNHTGFLINSPAWVQLGATNALPQGLQSQYILSLDLSSTVAPAITAVSLPTNNVTDIISSFTVNFSEDMDPRFNTLFRNVYKYGGHSYLVTDGSTSWQSAEAAAVSLGGHLAAISSSAENAWLNQTFSQNGELWLGLNLFATNGNWTWSSGGPYSFSNWAGGEPNNGAGYETAVKMRTDGTWDDQTPGTGLRGIIEVAGATDTDADGLVDSIDPYPTDPMNAFDLRAAGPDGLFDTADDVVYRIYTTGYSRGLSAPFAIADGPLQPGNYRFKVTTALKDRFGNALITPFVRNFSVSAVSGFITENRRGTSGTSTTSLSLNPTNQLDGSFALTSTVGSGPNPYSIAQGRFNGDTNLDLVTANWNGGGISILTNNGSGHFTILTNIATGNNPISVLVTNFDGGSNAGLAVANYNSGTVSILLGNGAGGFTLVTNLSGFSNPRNLAAADFNHDGKLDLAVPNDTSSGRVTVLFGTGNGNFTNATDYAVGSGAETVAAGDLNGDGNPDLVVANYNSAYLSVLMGSSTGAFTATTNYATLSNPRYVTLADVNGDGKRDAVVVNNGNYLSVFLGNGDGTFQPRTDYNIGSGDTYQVVLTDINRDGALDALVPAYGANRLITLLNNGDGTFGSGTYYANIGGNPISLVTGDYNGDGIPDIVTASWNNYLTVMLGNNTEGLAYDPAGTGLRVVAARGNLADGGDMDYWTFSAQTGDRLFIAAENPGNPAGSQLLYRIYNPDGSQWSYFYTDGNGRGQITLIVPASGTYSIRVDPYQQYYGEYRLRVTLAPPPVQMESEDNSSIANANTLTFAVGGGKQSATVLGYISTADGNGDFYRLGNLPDGTEISLGLARPANSALSPLLEIYNGSSAVVTNSYPADTNLTYTIPTGGGGAYYAHLTWAYTTRNSSVSNALYFNGNNNYVDVGNWTPGPQWSVQAWVMPVSLPGGRHNIGGSASGCMDWGVVLQDGHFGVNTRPPGGCSTTYEATDTAVPGTWYHVAAVSDGTNAYLYVNGVLAATGPVDLNYTPTAAGTRIGGDVCCGDYFPGLIQDISIWSQALSPTDVASYMASSPTGGEGGLAGYWRLQDGTGTTVPDLSTNSHTGTLVNGPSWVRLAPLGSIPSGLLQQYLLSISLRNTLAPEIVSVSLPDEGTISSNILDRFSIGFSEDMGAATITNAANYELRNAGPDNVFGTADDQLYSVLNSPAYSSGTSASYLITDGPLQTGKYRFTISTNLTDPVGTPLTDPYVRNFSVANVGSFVLEGRNNGSFAQATSLSLIRSNRADGSFLGGPAIGLPPNPERVAVGRINGDTNLDLAVALWNSSSVAVLLGNGDGSFTLKTNISTGNSAWSVALGDWNSDTNLDLAVVNYNANTVTILVGDGAGGFSTVTNYTVGSRPYHVATGDFDKDGRTDLAIPNNSSGNISILLGNGDGTFRGPFSYTVGSNPAYVAVGDVNGDGKPDLAVANYGNNNVSLLLGNGDGTFAPAYGIAAGQNPRALLLSDLNKDGKLDLAVFNGGDNTISVMFGNGDGSFQPRINYSTGTSDGYEILTADFNGDGWPDLAAGGYNNSVVSILLNNGDGTFQSPATYGLGGRCVGLVAGDFNNDGRADLAIGSDNANAVYTLLGNDTELLASDSADGSIRESAGRGNVASGEYDYWSFSGQAGDRVDIGSQNPGDPGGSQLLYRIYYPSGSQWTYFYTDSNGRGQLDAVLPVSGTYFVRVEQNNAYVGEYRFRVTLAKSPIQLESEDNNSIGQADTLAFTSAGGHQTARVLGCESTHDGGNDYFSLGNLSPGTVINVGYALPNSSTLVGQLAIYNSAGNLLTNGVAGTTNLSLAVSAAAAYYAQITAASNSAGLLATYVLNVDLADTTAPAITSVTLPAAGSTNLGILDRFTLGFNKDMDPALNGLNRYIRSYNGHGYTITDSSGNWFNAELAARAVGGHLASISDLLKNAWIFGMFGSYGNLWIGLSDEAQKDTYSWLNGDPLTYTNWDSGQPNNANNQDYVAMRGGGLWADYAMNNNFRGVVEVSGLDSDNDGIPDTLDPYPYDPLNGVDLRAAGPDGQFDTADDVVYHLTHDTYASGLSLNFYVSDGPLQPGYYRFTVTSSLHDRFGNGLTAPFIQYFAIAGLPGYAIAGRTNNTATAATPLSLTEDPAGVKSGAGRGKLFDGSDADYWSFSGTSNDLFRLAVEVPGRPTGARLHYEIFQPNGSRIVDLYPDYSTSVGQTAPLALPTNGVYVLRVTPYDGYYGEYRFRVTAVTPPLQMETEGNDTLATATPVTYAVSSNVQNASVSGYVRTPTDLDYINLGVVSNGYSIFLNARLAASSTLNPIVSVYNSANAYQAEAPGGRPDDGLAEVRVTQTDTYYAVVRGGQGTGGLDSQYLLDIQTVPTGAVSFPNLQVVSVTPPSGSGIQSGQPITYSFTVQNVGSLATPGANWLDRAALSTDTILGNADDIPLGFLAHNGALNPGESYSVTNTVTLPDGVSGDYYLIVFTDAGNAVNEFVFEGDNQTVSSSTFHINLAPYPDLRVENLNVTGPDANHVFTITWNTANRGTAAAPAGFYEHFQIRNLNTGALLTNVDQMVNSTLAVNSTLPHTMSVTTTNAANYEVQVVTDSRDNVFEYNATSHASAEANNIATTGFSITAYFNVAVQSSPPGAGTLTGAGNYASGSPVTATAVPVTNTWPYQFVNWTEGGTFQSASANYTFILTRDRSLTANFTLPGFQLTASNNPPAAGTVAGQGTYLYGTTNALTASANFGYKFTNWTENGVVIAATPSVSVVVTNNRFLVANYIEANTVHVVTTATSPTNVATVSGAGTYTNGQTATFTAALSITNPPNIYNFREFRVNGAPAGASASFNKTFSTLDGTNLQYVAYYDTASILPVVAQVTAGFTNSVLGGFTIVTNPIPAATNYQVALRFDRSMDTNVMPVIAITNSVAAVQPFVPTGGVWFASSLSNDTYRTPYITFSNGMDGAAFVRVSGARDTQSAQMAGSNVAALVIDVTPPPNPTLSLTASNSSSATISWSGYSPPADLNSFRVYLNATSFNSVTGLTAVSSVGSGTRSFTYYGLALDQPYYAAVAAVDNAGNSSPTVTALAFTLPTSVPPPVPVQVSAVGSSSAAVSWNSYNTGALLGFSGFRLYFETTNFTSVASLTPKQSLGAGARSVQIDNLDRTKVYYFAVVGYNANNGFNSNVTTATWSDPYAGAVSVNTTIGGGGQNVVDILQSITVTGNATLTIPAGTTLRFAPGTSLTIQQGALNANGTPLDPIVFTSAKDQAGQTPAAGDWNGITLASGAGGSVLRNVFVKFGGGLTLDNCSPTVDAFSALNNTPAGLTAQNAAVLNTTNALLVFNGIGARQLGSAQLAVINSVIKNNGTNALASGGLNLLANQDWWGTAVPTEIDALLRGAVDRTGYLSGEPLLTPAIGTSNNVTQVGSLWVNLRLACRTADSMRLSEDSTFSSVFFAPFTNNTTFALNGGGGQKTIFAQFRSLTGQTSAPVSVAITYITAGPTIASFNLFEGEVLTRPLTVTGNATAPLGMADLEFYVDGVGQATNTGGSFSRWFDVRSFSSGTHRVELLARDNSGNFSTLEHNVAISPTPPPPPAITIPAADLAVNTNSIFIGGMAEPFIQVRLFNSGTLIGTTNAAADGSFSFGRVTLAEGANQFTAQAIDALGSASSPIRNVNRDTLPPAPVVLNAPTYQPGAGLALTWNYPASGKRASSFEVFWNNTPITDPAQAAGHTLTLISMYVTLQSLPTGDYYFYVVGYDALGNSSPLSAPAQFHYDAVPPSFTVSFDKASPVGVGPLHVVLNASEPLNGLPTMTVQPFGSSPALLTLSNTAVNTYEGTVNVSALWPSGLARLNVSAQDLAGNPFNGAPAGPPLIIDVTAPAGVITTAPLPPVQATNNTDVAVSLQLDEAPQAGTSPAINFGPPTGAPVPVTMTGSGSNWNGTLTVTPAMGSGIGHFTMTVSDALGNVGHSINSGSALEIYNTALPSPPGQPVGFQATSLAGGQVRLTWSNVPLAEIYRVYSDPGTNQYDQPATLIADNLATNSYVDLPPVDGYYLYAVTASRRGSEGTKSITRVGLSDRTPPPPPTNVTVQLAAAGLQVAWQPGAGETPDHYNVYRNGTLIRTTGSAIPVIDNPPRGVMSYTVGAVDVRGNEAFSTAATIQLLVGAVNNLQALVPIGQAPALSWTSTDPTAVGFNVYRNGIKQNSAPLTAPNYSDTLPLAGNPVTYAVTALNSTNAESAARSVQVYPVGLSLLVNAAGGSVSGLPTTSYFDDYLVSVSNLTAAATFPLQQVEVLRTVPGSDPLNIVNPVNASFSLGNGFATDLAVPCSTNTVAQSVRIRAVQQTDAEGSSVIYQQTYSFPGVQTPGVMVDVSVDQLPLAGGLTPFNLRVYNRGYAPIYFATTRGGGSQPGDVYISVRNPQGQEVSRTAFKGTPPGIIFYGDVGYLMVPPGGSTTFTVPDVLVPEALASNTVTFQAVVSTIYDRGSASGQLRSGPLVGSMQSSLSQTPYYASAQTDRQLYSNDQPIVIAGQALDRLSGQPVPNVPVKIGFATRGYQWFSSVTTDSNGNYSYTNNPTPGFAGTLMIWAAHPDVYDQLNQAQVTIYRIYVTPQGGEIRMSKNDTLPFTLSIYNPGDVTLTGFTVGFQAFELQGTNQMATAKLQGTGTIATNFTVGPGQRQNVTLQLAADADAPDNALVLFTLTSAEGASATFTGNVTLLPAIPIVSVVQPSIGYVEVSLDRGSLLSQQVTIMNSGLKDLTGVSIIPPTNVTWMVVNLPSAADGTIPLPDLPVGASNSFTVVFTPPTNTVLGFAQDKLTVRGTNAQAGFDVGLYVRVTSSQVGAVQFYVDDILGLDVPNATVRLRNTALQVELPPVQTDINGLVTVTNLQEGDWSWQIIAPGHSANVGVVTVVPDQTVNVSTRLSTSVVTVNFTVTPVPFTDKYDITIEQTFQTHVPVPVLVLTPTYQKFENVTPGFQASFVVTAKNEGLIELDDMTITGSQNGQASFTPLITYVPVLLPQQSIEIPFTVTYYGSNAPAQQGLGGALVGCLPNPFALAQQIADFLQGLNAIAQAAAHCVKDGTPFVVIGTVCVTLTVVNFITGAAGLLTGAPEAIASYIGCVIGTLLSGLGSGGSGTGPGGGSVQDFNYSGPPCFAAETRVLLADGRFKTIDQIKPGDVVKSGPSQYEFATVAETHERQCDQCREIRFALPGQAEPEIVRTTDEHLFWVDGKGWVSASQLEVGEWLSYADGNRVQITGNERLPGSREVFTLKLRGDSAFYANGVLVHDLCGAWTPQGPVAQQAAQPRAPPLRLNNSQ